MPYSDPDILFDEEIINLIRRKNFSRYLDIGAGAGKYGKIIKSISQSFFVECIEPDEMYITDFDLFSVYDKVYAQCAERFIDDNPDYFTDIVIIGDCIEHLKKSDGVDLIHFLMYRCKQLIIVFPSKYIQYSWKGHALEAHRSIWLKQDFDGFECQYLCKEFMNMVIIRGYLDDPEAQFPKQQRE